MQEKTERWTVFGWEREGKWKKKRTMAKLRVAHAPSPMERNWVGRKERSVMVLLLELAMLDESESHAVMPACAWDLARRIRVR